MKAWPEKLRKNASALSLALVLWVLLAAAAPGTGGMAASWLMLAAAGALGGWWWWRRPRSRIDSPGVLQCLDRLQLGPGSTLYLVQVEGERLLVASGEKTAVILSRLPRPADEAREGQT